MSRASLGRRDTGSLAVWTTGSCLTGKREHQSRRSAKAHAARLRPERLREYLCEHCGAWHVGHLPARVRRGELTAKEHYRLDRGGAGPDGGTTGLDEARPNGDLTAMRSSR